MEKTVTVTYVVQFAVQFEGARRWLDGSEYLTLAIAREAIARAKEDEPLSAYQVVRRTITDEVMTD